MEHLSVFVARNGSFLELGWPVGICLYWRSWVSSRDVSVSSSLIAYPQLLFRFTVTGSSWYPTPLHIQIRLSSESLVCCTVLSSFSLFVRDSPCRSSSRLQMCLGSGCTSRITLTRSREPNHLLVERRHKRGHIPKIGLDESQVRTFFMGGNGGESLKTLYEQNL